jgi:hypothetical protein
MVMVNGKWKMEDGRAPGALALYHLPFTIFHSGRRFSAA